ncbi:MAG: hypothetical protein QG597_1531 [Actinomycetota bacterium]|nr:hypothetical protein [Actinomycetota bacterium]
MKHRANQDRGLPWLVPAALIGAVLSLGAIPAAVMVLATPDEDAPVSAPSSPPFALVDDSLPTAEELAVHGELPDPAAAAPAELPAEGTEATEEAPTKRLGEVWAGTTVLRVGDSGLPVKFVQQRLTMAGIEVPENGQYDDAMAAAVTRLQQKFDLTASGRVNRYTLTTLAQITGRGPGLPAECLTGTVLCIDKTQKVVRLVVDGTPEVTLDARFGSFGTATNEGLFEVYEKRADDWSDEFGVPMRYSMYFSGGQAIHYSDFFATEGYSGASHGCVNTRDLEATAAMFDMVSEGTSVYVYT